MSTTPTPIVPNPLTDLIPARARKYVYALAALALVVYAAWQASGGDWRAFAASLAVALVPGLAASNTAPKRHGLRTRR